MSLVWSTAASETVTARDVLCIIVAGVLVALAWTAASFVTLPVWMAP